MSYAIMRHLRRTVVLTPQIRFETTMTNITRENFVFRPPIAQWGQIIKEAEKIVGYPTSFMNLRWLLSDEFANLAMHLRKVVDTNHPIIKTAKTVIYNEHNNLQPWGLVILLLSKAVNPPTAADFEQNSVNEKQRILAELTEMIRTGHYIHRGLLNIPLEERGLNSVDTSMFANKIAILIGDYLLVTANGMLAKLKNQDLSYLISTALRDVSEGEFFGMRDKQNMSLPGKPVDREDFVDEFKICFDTLPLDVTNTLGSPIREWTLRTMYNGGSLFGRGCQGAFLLSGQSLDEQEIAYSIGCHMCLAWQAASELQKFNSGRDSFSLVSAPVLFAINENPELYSLIEEGKDNVTDVDLGELKRGILKTNALERTKWLHTEHSRKAKIFVQMVGHNDPVITLKRLIRNTI